MKLKPIIFLLIITIALFAFGCGNKDDAAPEEPTAATDSAAASDSAQSSDSAQATESVNPEPGAQPGADLTMPTATAHTAASSTTEKFTGTYKGYDKDTGLVMLYLQHESSTDGVSSPLDRQAAVYDTTPIIDAQTGTLLTVADLTIDSKLTAYLTPLKSRYEVPLGRAEVIFANFPADMYQMPVYIDALRVTADDDGDVSVLNQTKDIEALIPKNMQIEVFGKPDTTLAASDIKQGDQLLVWFDPAYYPPMAMAKRVILLNAG